MKTARKSPVRLKEAARRVPLTRERALQAALRIADAGGLEALTMRRLADALKVEAMSLYHHVENKTAILDGMVDLVFEEVALPPADLDWRPALRRRMASLREVLVRHRWALPVLESRTNPGPATLAQHDAVLGCLRRGGFGIALAGHAFAALDSYVFGFVHTELTLPFETSEETLAVARGIFEQLPPGAFPHLTEFTLGHVLKPGYTFSNEFGFGLDLILDGLERARAAEAGQRGE